MKNKMLLSLSIIVVLLFIVSCAPKMSGEELSAEISKLSPEEREAVIAEDDGALAGNARANPAVAKFRSLYQGSSFTCSDTDADANHPTGKDYFKKGTITWSGGPFPGDDICGNEQLLRENYCSGIPKGIRIIENVYCDKIGPQYFPGSSDWKCVDGACVNKFADLKVTRADFTLVLNKTTGKDDIQYVLHVQNLGSVDAGAFGVKVEPLFSGATVQVNGVSSLLAGATYTVTGIYSPYNASMSACPGAHDLNITLDHQNWVKESDEANNGYVLKVTC
ncbi:MAG: CARDB domain-containing protein [Nanoarchaeota archaeon]|nr:CARDB domain-containing protein [Nanoarchaeota archaeon]